MSQSALAFADHTNGSQQSTSGLWVHNGRLSVGPPGQADAPRLAGDLNVSRGDGTGVIYFAGEAAAPKKFLLWTGAQWQFQPPLGAGTLAPGAAQALLGTFYAVPSFSTTPTGVWTKTPVSVNITTAGGLLRLECSFSMTHSVAGGGGYVGFGWDGGIGANTVFVHCPGASMWVPVHIHHYITLGAGAHSVDLWVYNNNTGTLSIGTGYARLDVTEQKA